MEQMRRESGTKCCGFSLIDVSPRVFSDLTLALYRLTKAA